MGTTVRAVRWEPENRIAPWLSPPIEAGGLNLNSEIETTDFTDDTRLEEEEPRSCHEFFCPSRIPATVSAKLLGFSHLCNLCNLWFISCLGFWVKQNFLTASLRGSRARDSGARSVLH